MAKNLFTTISNFRKYYSRRAGTSPIDHMKLRSGTRVQAPTPSPGGTTKRGRPDHQRSKAELDEITSLKRELADRTLEAQCWRDKNNDLARKQARNELLVGYILAYIQFFDPEMKGQAGPEGFEILKSVLKTVSRRGLERRFD